MLIKVGWTVILDENCLETEIVRHLDIYGSLILRDPGAGNTVKLKAQSIHIAAGKGYLKRERLICQYQMVRLDWSCMEIVTATQDMGMVWRRNILRFWEESVWLGKH